MRLKFKTAFNCSGLSDKEALKKLKEAEDIADGADHAQDQIKRELEYLIKHGATKKQIAKMLNGFMGEI